MNLASPPDAYSRADQAQMREALRRADGDNHKRGRDLVVGPGKLVLTDTVTGALYAVSVASGVLVLSVL